MFQGGMTLHEVGLHCDRKRSLTPSVSQFSELVTEPLVGQHLWAMQKVWKLVMIVIKLKLIVSYSKSQ